MKNGPIVVGLILKRLHYGQDVEVIKIIMSFKLNRFSDEKMIQVEQLIAYATLLGLSGEDLVSIGGKISREQSKAKKINNMEIVKSFECLPIGRDRITENSVRFKLKTTAGSYNFENMDHWNQWEIFSLKTKTRKMHSTGMWEYELPKTSSYQTRSRYALLLDIANGRLQLNF